MVRPPSLKVISAKMLIYLITITRFYMDWILTNFEIHAICMAYFLIIETVIKNWFPIKYLSTDICSA